MHGEALLVLIGFSIFAAAVVGFKRGLATAFLEILAGLLLGTLVGAELPEVVDVFSELGLITLMFMAGLEVDIPFMRKKAKKGIIMGASTFVASFFIVGGTALAILGLNMDQTLIFAIGLSECSAGVVYSVLRRKGELGTRRKIILSAAMVMELLGIALLTIFFADISWNSILVVAFLLFMWLVYTWAQNKYHFLSEKSTENLALKGIMATLLTSAFLATGTGVDVVLIVFVLGMLLADFVENHSTLKHEIEAISFGFFTPFFFFTTGYHIDVFALIRSLPVILLLTLVSFAVTFAVGFYLGRKYVPKRALVVGKLLNVPMGVGLVIATIGLEKEILEPEMYIVLVGTILLSSFISLAFTKYPQNEKDKLSTPQS